MALNELDFLDGMETPDGTLIIGAQDRTVDMEEEPHTVVAVRTPDGTWDEPGAADWGSPGISPNAAGTGLVLVSEWGSVLEYTLGGHGTAEIIEDMDPEDPPTSFAFAKVVAGRLYAGGTRHHLHEYDGRRWHRITSPALRAAEGVQCFESITGFGPEELYAFGWDGVVWTNAIGNWQKVESPTNLILNDGDVFGGRAILGGQMGTIIEGRGNDWRPVEHDEPIRDIWSVRTFLDKVYFATMMGIFSLDEDGTIELAAPLHPGMRSTMMLFTGPSGLWSVGRTDIAVFDGATWTTIAQS